MWIPPSSQRTQDSPADDRCASNAAGCSTPMPSQRAQGNLAIPVPSIDSSSAPFLASCPNWRVHSARLRSTTPTVQPFPPSQRAQDSAQRNAVRPINVRCPVDTKRIVPARHVPSMTVLHSSTQHSGHGPASETAPARLKRAEPQSSAHDSTSDSNPAKTRRTVMNTRVVTQGRQCDQHRWRELLVGHCPAE